MQGHTGSSQYAPAPPQGGYAPPSAAGTVPNGTPAYPGSSIPSTTAPPRPIHQQPTPPVAQLQQMKIGQPPQPMPRPPMPSVPRPAPPMQQQQQQQQPRPGGMPLPFANGHVPQYPQAIIPPQQQQQQTLPRPPHLQQQQQQPGTFPSSATTIQPSIPQPRPPSMPTIQPSYQQQQPAAASVSMPYSNTTMNNNTPRQPNGLMYPSNTNTTTTTATMQSVTSPAHRIPPTQPPLQQPGIMPQQQQPMQQQQQGYSAQTQQQQQLRPPQSPAPPSFSMNYPSRPTMPQQPMQPMQPMQSPHQYGYPPPPPPSLSSSSSTTTTTQAPAPPTMTSSGSGPYKNIDPGQMPRPPSTLPPTQVFETRRQNTHVVPPPADNPIVVRDNGSAGPRYIRCSLNAVPTANDLMKASCLPFVAVINPLAITEQGDTPVSVIDCVGQNKGPMRCGQCKAYVCPYMQWIDGGRRMRCCFCGNTTDVPEYYYSHMTIDGTRQDILDRPELRYGCVEYTVAGEYQVRPPPPPTFLFLIDATPTAIASGATGNVCASVSQLLDELPGGARTRVGIVTFDSRVQFYSVAGISAGGVDGYNGVDTNTTSDNTNTATNNNNSNNKKWSMLVMSDVQDPYSPLGGDAVTVNLHQHKHALRAVLESIPKMFPPDGVGEGAGGAALKACVDALKQSVGGRLISFISSLPRKGALSLRPREAGKPPGERDALDVMNIEGKEYTALANDAAEYQVSIDIFALTQGYVDLATMSTLCHVTSGSVYRYNPFVPGADAARFYNDLRWSLVRPQGLEAVARLRVSSGLAVENYLGAFHRRNMSDIHFSAVSCDHAVAAHIVHEERLPEGKEIYLQYALLYSTMEGQRRVRVLTLALPVTRSYGSIYRGADMDVYLAYLSRKVSMQMAGKSLVACRDVVLKVVVDTLSAYRKHCATSSSSGQLILPESLKLLPIYALGLTKIPCFRTDSRADSRAVWMWRIATMPIERVAPSIHPRFIALHDIIDRPSNLPIIPEKLALSAEKLQPEGIYLLENGYDAYLYVGAGVSRELCSALLGVQSAEAVDQSQFAGPPELDTPISKAVRKVIDEVRRQRKAYMHLRLMRRGHPQEAAFLASLIEDRSPSAGTSYVEYLCYLHRQIQNKLT